MQIDRTREQREHGNRYKPYGYYKSDIPFRFPGVELHWHPETELNYITEGCAEFICGDEKLEAGEGDVILILPNMLHSIRVSSGGRCVYDTLVFDASMLGTEDTDRGAEELIKPLLKGDYGMSCLIRGDESFRECSEEIFRCIEKDTALADIRLKSELIRFFWMLFEKGRVNSDKNISQGSMEQLRGAIEHINKNYMDNITIENLADKAHLSRSYFMAAFKKRTGMGAMEYVNRVRIRAAERRLWDGDENIVDIAYDTGFRNLSNFNRRFKEKTGMTPSEYRKSRKKHDKADRVSDN